MAKYSKLENNSEVMDVLYAIVSGIETQKEIVKKLKQNRSTVSSKIWFLKKNNVVIKNKWSYSPNWDIIYNKMLNALNDVLNYYISLDKNAAKIKKNIKVYFPKKLLKSILRIYSFVYLHGYEQLSMRELMYSFLAQLRVSNEKRIMKINPKLLEVKGILSEIPSKEEILIKALE